MSKGKQRWRRSGGVDPELKISVDFYSGTKASIDIDEVDDDEATVVLSWGLKKVYEGVPKNGKPKLPVEFGYFPFVPTLLRAVIMKNGRERHFAEPFVGHKGLKKPKLELVHYWPIP